MENSRTVAVVLEGFDGDTRHDIMEDSRYLDWYDRTISLLWLKFDLEDDD